MYITTGEFIREVVDAIESGKISDTRNKYKRVDLLLIDDIQFLEKSESTQEEFFHTFNALVDQNRQIVISADRAPGEIKDLEDRIKRHHEWVANMQKQGKEIPPDRQVPSDLRPGPAMDQNRPGNCYASIIAPLAGLAVKGAIQRPGFSPRSRICWLSQAGPWGNLSSTHSNQSP